MAPKKNTRGSAEPEATAEKKKGGSVISGLDLVVRELADKVEKQVKEVGGDVARGLGERAVALMREAEEHLYRAEKEDR